MKFIPRLFLLLLILPALGFGQKKWERKGDERMNNLAYAEAIPYYLHAIKKKSIPAVEVKLAKCYFLIRDFENAQKWYTQTEAYSPQSEEYLFQLAHIKLNAGDWEGAKAALTSLSQNTLTEAWLNPNFDPDRLYSDTAFTHAKPLSFNTPDAEFSPFPYQDGFIFASSRKLGGATEWTFSGLNQPFLNLWYIEEEQDSLNDSVTNWSKPELINGEIRSNYNESNFTMADGTMKAWFSRNNFVEGKAGKSEDQVLKLGIFSAEMKKKAGNKIESFSQNNPEYNLTHPSISRDGRAMYFSSDMPGGEGGKDIYRSEWNGGEWGEPENLGPKINTPKDEVFPFIHPEGFLFFSSDGHPGLGFFDIFEVNLNAGSLPRNPGAPINSPYDDFGIYVDDNRLEGIFSSNRPEGSGREDLYEFRIDLADLMITVTDSLSGIPIENARVDLKPRQIKKIDFFGTDSLGQAAVKINRLYDYIVTVNTSDYDAKTIIIEPDPETGLWRNELKIRLYNPPPAITATIVEDSTGKPIPQASVLLINSNEQDTLLRQTDRYGRFATALKHARDYQLIIRKEGYYSNQMAFSTGFSVFDVDTVIPLKLEKVEMLKPIRLKNIHYDYAKWDIRPESKPELDRLVQIMEQNPELTIELGSHTDCRGSDSYNKKLSEKRAQSAVDYLVGQGIDQDKIIANGYGETRLLNHCEDGIECSDEEHFKNRRTEFTIVGYKGKIIRENEIE